MNDNENYLTGGTLTEAIIVVVVANSVGWDVLFCHRSDRMSSTTVMGTTLLSKESTKSQQVCDVC